MTLEALDPPELFWQAARPSVKQAASMIRPILRCTRTPPNQSLLIGTGKRRSET